MSCMIDIHTHILPGIDDGSRSMDESIEIIKKASSCGVTDIIVTPHYITGSNFEITIQNTYYIVHGTLYINIPLISLLLTYIISLNIVKFTPILVNGH